LLQEKIREIRDDPCSFWVGGGDYADYISYTDRRFDPACISDDLAIADLGQLGLALTTRVRDMFKPIAHKGLGLLFGNHEVKYMREHNQQNLHAWLCTELSLPNLGYSALFDLVFIRKHDQAEISLCAKPEYGSPYQMTSVRVFVHHGASAAQSHGGRINRLAKFMTDWIADIYMIGHTHDAKGLKIEPLGGNDECSKVVAFPRIGTITGGFLRAYDQSEYPGYGEVRAYTPTPLGAACVEIKPDTREMFARI